MTCSSYFRVGVITIRVLVGPICVAQYVLRIESEPEHEVRSEFEDSFKIMTFSFF